MQKQKQKHDRLGILASALEAGGSLHLKEAASLLGVSEMTVRRDIATSKGRFTYLGGYIVSTAETSGGMGYFLDKEVSTNIEAKRMACRAAAGLIENGDTIFIDCGTTMPHLASAIPSTLSLTVVCYAMNVAEIVCKKPNLKVVMLGGVYHPSSASFGSKEALAALGQIGINKAFLSAGGIHEICGLSCSNFHEVEIKQLVLARALKKFVIVDSTKFGKVKPAYFSPLDAIDAVVTDSNISDEHRAALAEGGIMLHLP